MATFTYNGITYTANFYDTVSGSNGNDASTPALAKKTLPDISTLAANTAVIIRRTNVSLSAIPADATITTGQRATNSNIMYIGCPLSTDPIYSVINTAVSLAAWNGDAGKYAQINSNLTSSTYLFHFYGASTNLTNTYISGLHIYQNWNTSSQWYSSQGAVIFLGKNGTINNCYFDMYSNSTGWTLANFSTHIRLGTADGNSNENLYKPAIVCNSDATSNYLFSNITFNWYGGYYCIYVSGYSSSIIMSNVVATGYTYTYNAVEMIHIGSDVLNLQVIGSSFLNYSYYVGYASSTWYESGGITNGVFDGCSFSNNISTNGSCNLITIGNTSSSILFYNCTFTTYFDPTNPPPNSPATICTIDGKCTFRGCAFNSNINPWAKKIYVIGAVNVAYAQHNHINTVFNMDGIIFSDITIATANILQGLMSGCTFTKGTPCLTSPLYIPTITASEGTIIAAGASAILYCDNLITNHSPAISTAGIYLGGNAKVFITNSDIDLTNLANYGLNSSGIGNNFNGSDSAVVYVANNLGYLGNWAAISLKATMTSVSAYRTSGSNYSIKYQPNTGVPFTSLPYLWIAPIPFNGIAVPVGTSGAHTITVYYAYKSPWTAPTSQEMYVVIESPDGGVTNLGSGQMVADPAGNGSWHYDTVTAMKCVTSFTLSTPGTCYVRIGVSKNQATGYLLIDPVPVLT